MKILRLHLGRVALDKGEGFVKGRDILSGVCDTACAPEKAENQDSGNLTLNHPAVGGSFALSSGVVPPTIDTASTATMILPCEHPAAGPVRKGKTVFLFSKARERRLRHRPVWMRERPINIAV